jgi:hypothetical protein
MPASRATRSADQPRRSAAHSTTLRAACASRLMVSSTRPAPTRGLESTATRSVLGSFFQIEGVRAAGQFHRPLEQSKVQVGPNQPRAEVDQGTLGKGGLIFAEPVESPSATADPSRSDRRPQRRRSPGSPAR